MANIKNLQDIAAAETFGRSVTAVDKARTVAAFVALFSGLLASAAIPLVMIYMTAIYLGFR